MTKVSTPPLTVPGAELLERFRAIVGDPYALSDPAEQQPYLKEWRDLYTGKTPLVLRPGTTQEVSAILKLANKARVGIVPQGGNTGLAGGQIPDTTGTEVVVSVARLNRIRDIDSAGSSMTLEAGVTLAAAQATAAQAGRLFPLSMASEGSCLIGGNLATNAGGTAVLAYGTMRSLVLGLEVVLADGRVWNGLRSLKKDNTGYDLKELFIGSEGTLGIITAAVLKLYPAMSGKTTAFAALGDMAAVSGLFELAERSSGGRLTSFEFISTAALEIAVRHLPAARAPFTKSYPWYALLEISTPVDDGSTATQMENLLATAAERHLIHNATIANSIQQVRELWRLREGLSEAQKHEGASIKHDISVPVPAIPEFVAQANVIVEQLCPGARPVPFGHFGDGNVHYNISQPPGMDRQAFLALWPGIAARVHALAAALGGSISAEHGIGRLKRDDLQTFKSSIELDLMRSIKTALDPNGILNPGKLIPGPPTTSAS